MHKINAIIVFILNTLSKQLTKLGKLNDYLSFKGNKTSKLSKFLHSLDFNWPEINLSEAKQIQDAMIQREILNRMNRNKSMSFTVNDLLYQPGKR